MGAKHPLDALNRMRQAVEDERVNGRVITKWRVSRRVLVSIELENFNTRTGVHAWNEGVRGYFCKKPVDVISDWHGEIFEYDTEPPTE